MLVYMRETHSDHIFSRCASDTANNAIQTLSQISICRPNAFGWLAGCAARPAHDLPEAPASPAPAPALAPASALTSAPIPALNNAGRQLKQNMNANPAGPAHDGCQTAGLACCYSPTW